MNTIYLAIFTDLNDYQDHMMAFPDRERAIEFVVSHYRDVYGASDGQAERMRHELDHNGTYGDSDHQFDIRPIGIVGL